MQLSPSFALHANYARYLITSLVILKQRQSLQSFSVTTKFIKFLSIDFLVFVQHLTRQIVSFESFLIVVTNSKDLC